MAQRRPLLQALSEAKDVSELMVDLAYGGLFYDDGDLAREVLELEDELTDLVHEMRQVCLLAARSTKDAEGLAAVIQVIGAIEMIGNQAVDIAKILLRGTGIPMQLRADLAAAAEVVHRVEIRPGARLVGTSLAHARLPSAIGVRVLAILRAGRWRFDPDGREVLSEQDVMVVKGAPDAIPALRQLCGAPALSTREQDTPMAFSELDKAVDTVVEMKNVAEVCVGLAYAALMFQDRALASEVNRLEDRLDEMRSDLEVWVLQTAAEARDVPALRGLLRLGDATETIGDAAQAMVWLVERGEQLHPVMAGALGAAEEIVARVRVLAGGPGDGASLGELQLKARTGMFALALRREGRWQYRPGSSARLRAADELLLTGPPDGVGESLRLLGDGAAAPA